MICIFNARQTDAQGRRVTWADTRNVASLPRRLTSLVMVFTLSGSPAVLAACMAVCLGVATAASLEGSTSVGHAAHTPVPAPTVASGHAHHGSAASNEPTAVATNRAFSPAWSDARVSAACGDCCAAGRLALVASAGVERVNALTLGAGPAASPVASFLLTTSVLGASSPGPLLPPPSPTRAPLVLRI